MEPKNYGSNEQPMTRTELDAQPSGPAGEAPKQPEWTKNLDSREWSQVLHAQAYVRDHQDAGAPGHGQFLLIAKLAKMLDDAEHSRNNSLESQS